MATLTARKLLAAVYFLTIAYITIATVPDFAVLQTNVENLDVNLKQFMDTASGIEKLLELYTNNQNEMTFEPVDGAAFAQALSKDLHGVLKKKMEALQRSVDWAEKLAANYTWNPDLTKSSVVYNDSKSLNKDDPSYRYNEKFMQNVSFDYSAVHVPVEIYNGDIDILNGLEWSAELDQIWQDNRERDPNLLWQYFGSQLGYMRTHPASEWQSNGVDLFDVRRRPWYTQGASSPKDMLILMDVSGSVHGQALSLMKQSVNSLLETLGENDFVNVGFFSDTTSLVGCFDTFVQANYRNKKKLAEWVEDVKARGMANYALGFEFAFEEFIKFYARPDNGEGARCNPVIMFLTDGGTEMPEEVFKTYNWPEKNKRIFTYAIGATANPIAAVRWIACANRGYFDRIPAMGAIRSTVQKHVPVVARPLALNTQRYLQWSNIYSDALSNYFEPLSHGLVVAQNQEFKETIIYEDFGAYVAVLGRPMATFSAKKYQWTNINLDPMGLGMMTTVTLPVYNRTQEGNNQTILGVMGSDVTTQEMEDMIPKRKLSPNGYAFAINSNGYIVFHPNLKAQQGWLTNPPNVDLLEVEHESEDKVELRKKMIDSETGEASITTHVLVLDNQHTDNITRVYSYTSVPDSSWSLAVVTPAYHKFYLGSVKETKIINGIKSLESDKSAKLVASWEYCGNLTALSNTSTFMEDFAYKLENEYDECDKDLVQELFFDTRTTEAMDAYWEGYVNQDERDGVDATWVATSGGLTRIFPASENETFAHLTDTWEVAYFRRAIDNNEKWMYSAPFYTGISDPNATASGVYVTKTITLDNDYRPAVAGVLISQERLRNFMLNKVESCQEPNNVCYLLDDGGFLMTSTDDELDLRIGDFFGNVEPALMYDMYNKSVYLMKEEYDYQASCPHVHTFANAGPRSVHTPVFYEMLTLSWWTTKLFWLYTNFNIYNTIYNALVSPTPNYAYAESEVPTNYSCIKKYAQYHYPQDDGSETKNSIECRNCTRTYATARLDRTNLLLVIADRPCRGECTAPELEQAPVEVEDPSFADGNCPNTTRYRRRPEGCYDYDNNEDVTVCGTSALIAPTLTVLLVQFLVSRFISDREC